MKLINNYFVFNPINNGYVYICRSDDGAFWIRSVAGKWAELTIQPATTEELDADFQTFLGKNAPSSELEVKADNTDQIIVEPPKFDNSPSPRPDPIPDPIPVPDPVPEPDPVATSTPAFIK